MKKLSTLLLLMLTSLLFVACSKSEDSTLPTITITTSEFTVGAEAGSEAKATFDINVDWTTTISYEGDATDWLTVTPQSGGAGQGKTITMEVTVNPDITDRKAYVAINYGAANPHKLTVTQKGENAGVPTITITTSEFIVEAEADSEAVATFDINVDWTTTISYEGDATDWLTATPQSGGAGQGQTITMKATENPDVTERKAYVAINYGATNPHKLTVTQKGGNNITVYFDPPFAAELEKRGYISDAARILLADVADIKIVNISNSYETRGTITNLAGIEYFQSLTILNCDWNQIHSLDLSKNTELTYLACDQNRLTSLDLSENTKLTSLTCIMNSLTTLDVSKNTKLSHLSCPFNQLTSLDVSKNTALTFLNFVQNKITTLDVSKNTALLNLECGANPLFSVDVSKNKALTRFSCHTTGVTTIDISNNLALTFFSCYDNQLTSIDVSKHTAINVLTCHGNQFTSLDLSKNTALTSLKCDGNKLTSLDLSNNTKLAHLFCYGNQLTALDVSNNPAIVDLYCADNQLATLTLGGNSKLQRLVCSVNNLTTFDPSEATSLSLLYCHSNQITSLNIGANVRLSDFSCMNNKMTSLDISNNRGLGGGNLWIEDNPGNGGIFAIKAWFDDSSIPGPMPRGFWVYEGSMVTISYHK